MRCQPNFQQTAWNVGGDTQFDGQITAPPGSNFSLNVKGTANTKKIDLSSATVPVTIEVPTSSSSPTLIGGMVDNIFIKNSTEHVNETDIGGPAGSTNLFNIVPGSDVTLVSQGGDNTIDLTGAEVPFISKTTDTVQELGVSLDLTQNNGQKQLVYQPGPPTRTSAPSSTPAS